MDLEECPIVSLVPGVRARLTRKTRGWEGDLANATRGSCALDAAHDCDGHDDEPTCLGDAAASPRYGHACYSCTGARRASVVGGAGCSGPGPAAPQAGSPSDRWWDDAGGGGGDGGGAETWGRLEGVPMDTDGLQPPPACPSTLRGDEGGAEGQQQRQEEGSGSDEDGGFVLVGRPWSGAAGDGPTTASSSSTPSPHRSQQPGLQPPHALVCTALDVKGAGRRGGGRGLGSGPPLRAVRPHTLAPFCRPSHRGVCTLDLGALIAAQLQAHAQARASRLPAHQGPAPAATPPATAAAASGQQQAAGGGPRRWAAVLSLRVVPGGAGRGLGSGAPAHAPAVAATATPLQMLPLPVPSPPAPLAVELPAPAPVTPVSAAAAAAAANAGVWEREGRAAGGNLSGGGGGELGPAGQPGLQPAASLASSDDGFVLVD